MPQLYKKYSCYLRQKFGTRVQRISVDAGFSCPNRDGTISTDGCVFCDNASFNIHSGNRTNNGTLSLYNQIENGVAFAQKKYNAQKYILYFQAYSNTYADPKKLKKIYDMIYSFENIVGISIATRPDCVNDEILDLIAEYTKYFEVWIEYGLQSVHNKTLEKINRGHTYEQFLDAYHKTKQRGIKTCVHCILGLPDETAQMMLETADEITRLCIDGIKLHPLYVVRKTKLEKWFKKGFYTPIEFDEYTEIAAKIITRLHPKTIIQRLTASCPPNMLIAPSWVLKKNDVEKKIREILEKNAFFCEAKIGL